MKVSEHKIKHSGQNKKRCLLHYMIIGLYY